MIKKLACALKGFLSVLEEISSSYPISYKREGKDPIEKKSIKKKGSYSFLYRRNHDGRAIL